ncbi:type I secretion system protein [Staphylococcus agnetis]|nr:type I secretion system protein [Staphylococcus agnetis]NJH96521.1 type I secretion system protein [Staphylococcus agnetis]PTH43803.1 type I secretion system protein [Staphylococcus agnetis]PTH71577.1 type I secretion system protein [Staphylococcus agnetis]PTH74647.1 type I secretion system protein [Staphylococcus agnetis]
MDFFSTIFGGILTLIGTLLAVYMQFMKQDKERDKEYQNDLVSMIDIVTYKSAKVRNNELNFNHSSLSKEDTGDIYIDIERDFHSLDQQIQELILMMSHHIDDSNEAIQKFLSYYEPVEEQFNKFKISYKIYKQQCDEVGFNTNAITFSKRKLDIAIENFINGIRGLAQEYYHHNVYEPRLNELVKKQDAKHIPEK